MPLEFVIVRMINESKRTPPKTFMPREQAEELWAAGLATWNAKRTALTLKKLSHAMWKPAPSLTPWKVQDAFVEGDLQAVAIINSYGYRHAA